MALGDQKGRYLRFATDPCASLWFHRFLEGCRYQIGQEWRPNQAMSIPLLVATLKTIEDKMQSTPASRKVNRWTVVHAFISMTYVVSLRGPEGFLLDLDGLNRHWIDESGSHFIIAFRRKLKGEHNARCHLLPCVQVTGTGLRIRDSVKRLLDLKASLQIRRRYGRRPSRWCQRWLVDWFRARHCRMLGRWHCIRIRRWLVTWWFQA
jgi:hypothetical protein